MQTEASSPWIGRCQNPSPGTSLPKPHNDHVFPQILMPLVIGRCDCSSKARSAGIWSSSMCRPLVAGDFIDLVVANEHATHGYVVPNIPQKRLAANLQAWLWGTCPIIVTTWILLVSWPSDPSVLEGKVAMYNANSLIAWSCV